MRFIKKERRDIIVFFWIVLMYYVICKIVNRIINKIIQTKKRNCLKLFSIYSPGGHFVQRNETIWAILVEGKPRNISVKLFQNLYTGLAEEVV